MGHVSLVDWELWAEVGDEDSQGTLGCLPSPPPTWGRLIWPLQGRSIFLWQRHGIFS